MKVLLVGMTAQQSNPKSVRRGLNFAGLVARTLQDDGHDVDWRDPDVEMSKGTLGRYDSVIVGVAPITSLGANRTYGALSTIWHLWDDARLTLLVDAPDPSKITASFTAIRKQPANLTKKFFSYRKQYSLAAEPRTNSRLLDTVELLADDRWPATLTPRLPWQQRTPAVGLPDSAAESTFPVNLDHLVIQDMPQAPSSRTDRLPVWGYEHGSDTRWRRDQNVSWDVGSLVKNTRVDADKAAIEQLRQISGLLIAPTRTGTWWSTRHAQALSQGCPVFTAWEESQLIGPAWAMLPGQFELLSREQRVKLHSEQVRQYLDELKVRRPLETIKDALTSERTATT